MNLKDKVILISGAAGDLGSAVVTALLDRGVRLALIDHREGRLQDLYPALRGNPEHLLIDSVDLTDEASVQRAVAQVTKRFGQIDILINTVGGYDGGMSLYETSLDTWQRMVDLNAKTVFLLCREVVPIMRAQGEGKIINVGSKSGLHGRKNMSAYSASKSAVLRLTESLAAEVEGEAINVNAVLPGTIDTPDNREAMPDANYDRWIKPEAIVDVILFLSSEASRSVSGALIPVYGTK